MSIKQPIKINLSEIMKNEVIGTGSIGTIYKGLHSNGDLIAVKPIVFPD